MPTEKACRAQIREEALLGRVFNPLTSTAVLRPHPLAETVTGRIAALLILNETSTGCGSTHLTSLCIGI